MLHRKEDRRQTLRYVLPSISAMVASCSYNVLDGIFVGQGVGASALAAVNLTVPFTEITTALASMLLNRLCVFAIPAVFGPEKIWITMIVAEGLTLALALCIKASYERGSAHRARAVHTGG